MHLKQQVRPLHLQIQHPEICPITNAEHSARAICQKTVNVGLLSKQTNKQMATLLYIKEKNAIFSVLSALSEEPL